MPLPRAAALSAAVIAKLPTTGERYVVRDTIEGGFAIRVYPTGTKVYTLDFRVAGDRAKHHMTLGTFPNVSVDKARSAARAAKVSASTDRTNPVEERAAAVERRRTTKLAAKTERDAAKAVKAADDAAARDRTLHTVEQLARDYLRDRRTQLKPNTAKLYASTITRYLTGIFGQIPVPALTQSDVREVLRTVQDGTLPAGITPTKGKTTLTGGAGAARTLRRFLASVWHYAESEREIVSGRSPVPGAKDLGMRELEKERFLTPEECGRLLEALDTAEAVGLPAAPTRPPRKRVDGPTAKHRPKIRVDEPARAYPVAVAAIRFALQTGWRKSEVLGLQWAYLRRDLGVIILPDTKTGESVRAVSEAAWTILTSLDRVVGSPWCFPSTRQRATKHAPIRDLSRLWESVKYAANIPDARFHDARHTAASLALNAGASLEEVQSMLGHLSARTTSRYAKLIPATGLRAAVKLEQALADARAKKETPVTPITEAPNRKANR